MKYVFKMFTATAVTQQQIMRAHTKENLAMAEELVLSQENETHQENETQIRHSTHQLAQFTVV